MSDPFALFEGLAEPGSKGGAPIHDYPGRRIPKNRPDAPRTPVALAEEVDVRWDEHPLVRTVNGKELELFSIGDFALALGRRPTTIRAWEAQGVIPKARLRTTTPKGEQVPGKAVKGRRLYTRYQIDAALAAAQATGVTADHPNIYADWARFSSMVKTAWKAEEL